MACIVPAVLSANERDFHQALAVYGAIPGVERIQIDVVDGRFADPASWPYTAPKEFRDRVDRGEMLPNLERIEYEIDLMCFDPEAAARSWLTLGASRLTVHVETVSSLPRLVAELRKSFGHIVSIGLAITVTSDIALFGDSLDEIAYVQFMGIARIGRQGQPYDSRVAQQIRAFRARYPHIPFQVDGGVSFQTAATLIGLGASSLVVGSAILRATDPGAVFMQLSALESSVRG